MGQGRVTPGLRRPVGRAGIGPTGLSWVGAALAEFDGQLAQNKLCVSSLVTLPVLLLNLVPAASAESC